MTIDRFRTESTDDALARALRQLDTADVELLRRAHLAGWAIWPDGGRSEPPPPEKHPE